MTGPRFRARCAAVLAATVTLAVSVLSAPPPAAAHRDPTLQVRLESVRPALPTGVRVDVLDGEQTMLGLSNPSADDAVVLDPDGEPFLRVSGRGVLGDLRSPFLAASRSVVEDAAPAPADCCPDAGWRLLSRDPVWAWPDPRVDPPLRPGTSDTGRGLGTLGQSAPLARWSVPVEVGGRTSVLRGVIERRQVGAVATTVASAPRGLEVSVVASTPPQLRMDLAKGTRVEVIGTDGRSIIRVDGHGALGRNASPDYQAARRAMGLPPRGARGWSPVAGGSPVSVTWADTRLDFRQAVPTSGSAATLRLGHWRIPLVVNGHQTEIVGDAVWHRQQVPEIALSRPRQHFWDSGGAGSYLLAGGLTVLLGGAVMLARRRARTVAP